MAMIAPLTITNNILANFISSKANLPTNFMKLGKYIMISGSSLVFNKKEKGSNDVYACFRLKSQVQAEDMVTRLSFEFNRLGRKNLSKKQNQAMETETPVMLPFVCNGTDQGSIKADTRQMLETAFDDIKLNEMVPEEFKNSSVPHECPLNQSKQPTRPMTTQRSMGRKLFYFQVTKSDISCFKFLSSHVHRLKCDTKYFGKFVKFTARLSSNPQ